MRERFWTLLTWSCHMQNAEILLVALMWLGLNWCDIICITERKHGRIYAGRTLHFTPCAWFAKLRWFGSLKIQWCISISPFNWVLGCFRASSMVHPDWSRCILHCQHHHPANIFVGAHPQPLERSLVILPIYCWCVWWFIPYNSWLSITKESMA